MNILNDLIHKFDINNLNLLIFNNEKILVEDIEFISKYFQNIYVVLDNRFSYTRYFIKLKSLKNVHIINSDRIPKNISFDVFYVLKYGKDEATILSFIKPTLKYIFIEYNDKITNINGFTCILPNVFQKNNIINLNNKLQIINIKQENFVNFEDQINNQYQDIDSNNKQNINDEIKDQLENEIIDQKCIIPKISNIIVRNSLNFYNDEYIKSYKNESKEKLKISIIIPTFNQSSFTIKCFKGIDKYCEKNYNIEIFWIDNGSDITEIEKVRNCVNKLTKVKVFEFFSNEKLGFVKATNWGIKEALKTNPDYIILQNNDTEVTSGWLTPMINALRSDNLMMLASPITNSKIAVQGFENVKRNFIKNMFSFDEIKTNEVVKKLHNEFSNNYILIDKDHQTILPAFFCVVLKPEIFSIIGLLDTNFGDGYGDDVEFCLRLLNKNFTIGFIPESYVLHNHRTTFSSICSFDEIKKTIKLRLEQIKIQYSLLNKENKKGVIYTCITGNYDPLKKLKYIDTNNFDYICFSDEEILNIPKPWKVIYINDLCKYLNYQNDKTKLARYFKLHPHLFFKYYDYSIWIDSNIDIISDINQLFEIFPENQFILTTKHPLRNCVYEECNACKLLKKDNNEIIETVEKFLRSENYPEQNGMVQSNFIIRRHNNEECKQIMNEWWKFIINYSKRDQLSFNYIFWKNKLSYSFIPWNKINEMYILLGFHNYKLRG